MDKTVLNTLGALFTIFMMAFSSCTTSKQDPAFVQAETEWRNQRDEQMKNRSSWLTIAGLYWLSEGENRFGTDAGLPVQLPEGSAPPIAGTFIRTGDRVKIISAEDGILKFDGKIIKEMDLTSDRGGSPDIVELNDLRMWVIQRGDRPAIRLRDFNAPRYKNYHGLTFYPPKQKYKINAEFVPYPEPKKITVGTVVGTEEENISPGYVQFQIDGKEVRLDAFESGPGLKRLFFVFRDGTSGKETYGASRFMTCDVLEDGSVDLNFNRAYNPPCAYTPYATCPLPPPQNVLSVRIEAGEKAYEKGH